MQEQLAKTIQKAKVFDAFPAPQQALRSISMKLSNAVDLALKQETTVSTVACLAHSALDDATAALRQGGINLPKDLSRAPSRKSVVASALRGIEDEELMTELRRRNYTFPRESDFLEEAGDSDLREECERREISVSSSTEERALELIRYGIEDKDWTKVKEGFGLF